MKIISTIILLFFVAIPIVFGFGGQTKMRIDEIYNNTGDNIILKPSNKVGIDYLTGDKIIQSTAEGLLEESTVTTTELGYLSGVTSSVQDQISSKQDSITGTDGDLYYWNSGLSNLTIGTEGQFLKVSSLGFPEWVDLPTAVSVTTKGDLQTYSTQADRLPVGTDGQVLQANSATSTGLEWVDADFYTSPLTTEGDLLYRDATQDTRLPIGTEDQVLTVNASGLPVWADSKGGGGSAGINFVFDPSFEKGDLNPDTDASAVESYQTYTADDKLYAEFNEQYYRAAYTGLTANNTYVRDTFARTDLDGKQGLFSIWIKADAENFELCLRTDDSGFASACDDAYKLNILGDNTWRKYEIPFVYGASSVEYEIKNASYTGDVTIELDNIYIGTIPDGYIQQVGQAHFVGSAQLSTNCIYSRNSTSYGIMTDADICSFTSTKGNVSQLSNPLIGGINISNIRTDGYYRVFYQGLMYNVGNANVCYFSLSKSTSGDATFGETYVTSTNRSEHNTFADIRFNDGESGDIYILNKSNVATQCSVYGSGGNDGYWSVYFYPDSSSTIVTQDTELTAKTANEFVAFVDQSGNVFGENFNWISGNCTNANPTVCTYASELNLSEPMVCNVTTSTNVVSGTMVINSSTTSSVSVTRYSSASGSNLSMFISCTKRGADYNKSATIVGKFENINSTDLCQLEVRGRNSDQSVTGNSTKIIWDTNEVKDNCNLWDGDEYTASKTGRVSINGMAQFFGATATRIDLYVNETTFVKSCSDDIAASNVRNFNCQIDLNAGDVLSFKSSATRTYASGGEVFNHLSIQELPDYEAIVKNLSDQKTKCQTKYLSADVTADGNLPDLSFANLVTGKKYKLDLKISYKYNNTTPDGISIICHHVGASDYVGIATAVSSDLQTVRLSSVGQVFNAANSTVDCYLSSLIAGGTLRGNNTRLETFATLCQLPDTYVETTEF